MKHLVMAAVVVGLLDSGALNAEAGLFGLFNCRLFKSRRAVGSCTVPSTKSKVLPVEEDEQPIPPVPGSEDLLEPAPIPPEDDLAPAPVIKKFVNGAPAPAVQSSKPESTTEVEVPRTIAKPIVKPFELLDINRRRVPRKVVPRQPSKPKSPFVTPNKDETPDFRLLDLK